MFHTEDEKLVVETEDEKLVVEEGERLTTMYGQGSTAHTLGGAMLRLVSERVGAREETPPIQPVKFPSRRQLYQLLGGDEVTIRGPIWLHDWILRCWDAVHFERPVQFDQEG